MMKTKTKTKAALIWVISMILVLMMFPFPTYAASYGHVGYHCYKSNPSSGIVIIGDSNTCQLWNYQHASASYCSTWGGHYGYGAKKGVQIDSPAYVEQMKKLITATIKKTGKCTVFLCGTNNDDNDAVSARNCMALFSKLNKYFFNNRVNGKRPVFYVVGPNGDKGDNMNVYNAELKRQVKSYKGSAYIKYTHIADCLTGSNGGYLSDNTHYNNATLKKILVKYKKLAK